MRRNEWLALGLAVATAVAAAPADDAGSPYRILGDLPVMAGPEQSLRGRVKPLDTLAREAVKVVYGRETVKLTGPDGKVVATWGPVACLFDWPARPDFWDDQDIILVEYLPLKQKILSGEVRVRLKAVANLKTTPAAERDRLLKLAAAEEVEPADLRAAATLPGVPAGHRAALETLAAKLEPSHKWLSPSDLQGGVVTIDGREQAFLDWFGSLASRAMRVRREMGGAPKFSDLERKVSEVGERLMHYQVIRDHNQRGIEDLDIGVLPRPTSDAYLAYTAAAAKKTIGGKGSFHDLNPVELDAANTLREYLKDLQSRDRELPGANAKFDEKYKAWLRGKAAWVPLRVVIGADEAELVKAGFDRAKLAAFREAYKAVEDSERDHPGHPSAQKAAALLAAARDLGEDLGRDANAAAPGFFGNMWRRVGLASANLYPTPAKIALESRFNRSAPFWWAPYAYGTGLVVLLVSLGIGAPKGRVAGMLARGSYWLGMLAFLGGIGLEVYGFALRVIISGWAPVTNMYETVIWVSLIAAVLGLVLELIYRKTFAALAGTGVAMLGTVLAAGFPSVMDPNIKALQPVLRSNYWLTIHVLTEVSSYAAFALAMGLGLIATFYYLTATYRRSVAPWEMLPPLLPGLPLLLMGAVGYYAGKNNLGPALLATAPVTVGLGFVFIAGTMMTLSPLFAMAGEVISRLTFRDEEAALLDEAAIAGATAAEPAATAAVASASAGGSATATLARPSVAEIRARAAAGRVKLDARARSMQATAARVKPLSNFIYRAMQVGVLLIAAGTFLGGWWADKSWGRFWGWDPKEVWALITLLIYLVPLHGRFAGLVNTFGLVAASVGCFLSVLMAWYGVNFVLGVGLHSYGFSEGGGQEGVALVTAIVLSIVFAAGWRRHRGLLPSAGMA
jgi:ABC-type transport system involved in cytochrome c biogenesis permease subunit